MLRVQLHLQDLFLLGRQLGGHLVLGAAPDQRPDPPLELGQSLAVALPLDRPGVVVAGSHAAYRTSCWRAYSAPFAYVLASTAPRRLARLRSRIVTCAMTGRYR